MVIRGERARGERRVGINNGEKERVIKQLLVIVKFAAKSVRLRALFADAKPCAISYLQH